MADFPTSGYPPMIGRRLNIAEWRSYVANYDFGPIAPTRLVLHHTYVPNEAQWRGLASMRGMQSYYASLGWSAAPHIYAGPDGIWLFTPMREVGIHAGIGNSGVSNGVWWYSIGLETVGYFDYQRPAGKVWEHACAVMGVLSQRLGIPPRKLISFHRDYTDQKSCPGWAVTIDWVVSQVEAWIDNTSPPPPPPPGPIGKPTPTDEVIMDRLLNQSYSRRSAGYDVQWAFHQYAVQHSLGAPLANSKRITVDGKSYSYQPFARDTLFSEVPNWGSVQLLSELLAGSIPPSGLGRVLLEASYRDCGATFHADWSFHQYAISARLGPPLDPGGKISLDGVEYNFQSFGVDTLYNPIPDWSNVQQLSYLARSTRPDRVRLREALLAELYRRVGARYEPGWSFHQLARTENIGAPLSDAYGIDIEGTPYNIQIYTLDTLFNIIPRWSEVRRLTELIAAQSPTLGRALLGAASVAPALLSAMSVAPVRQAGNWEPPSRPPFLILHHTSKLPISAYSPRDNAAIRLIVLHGDPGPAKTTLDRMTSLGSDTSTHYYIPQGGSIYRLVADELAAWHLGKTDTDAQRGRLNRISLGIVLERPKDTPPESDAYSTQRAALRWLIADLARRYALPPNAVVRWRDLEGYQPYLHSERPLDDINLGLLVV